jgi:signal transduction histidine kinase
MNLLRIGQEAVANAIKHGHASNVQIELHYGLEKVILKVRDDGCGFSPDRSNSAGHFGMLDMHERSASLGCHLQIESVPGHGTVIAVEVQREKSIFDADFKAHTHSGRG